MKITKKEKKAGNIITQPLSLTKRSKFLNSKDKKKYSVTPNQEKYYDEYNLKDDLDESITIIKPNVDFEASSLNVFNHADAEQQCLPYYLTYAQKKS